MILVVLIAIVCLYLSSNLCYTFFSDWVFNYQRAYMSLKELKKYKNMIILNGGGASIKFDYEWGIKFTPLTYWYYLYLCIIDAIKDAKWEKENKVVPPWRLK